MHPGIVVNWKEETVQIDNYSLNRVVNVNEGASFKYLITNNIEKKSSRMMARYSSLLPLNIPYFEAVSNLLFYPFASLTTTKDKSRYDFIILSKKKHRIPIKYCLKNA